MKKLFFLLLFVVIFVLIVCILNNFVEVIESLLDILLNGGIW